MVKGYGTKRAVALNNFRAILADSKLTTRSILFTFLMINTFNIFLSVSAIIKLIDTQKLTTKRFVLKFYNIRNNLGIETHLSDIGTVLFQG
jgi:hypothetical protein